MRTQKVQSLTVFLGAILALAIVCSQLFHFEVNSAYKKEVKTEEHKTEQAADETFISMPSFSLPSYVNVQLTVESYCLFEIIFKEDKRENRSSEIPLHPEKFLQTLFSVIISPNAP